jgi:flagellar biogenesis protein FliO
VIDRLTGSEVPQVLLAALSLAAVLLLVAAAGWLVRRAPSLLPPQATPGIGIALQGTLRLDARRRLHLVQVGGQQALVLTGGATDVIARLSPADS